MLLLRSLTQAIYLSLLLCQVHSLGKAFPTCAKMSTSMMNARGRNLTPRMTTESLSNSPEVTGLASSMSGLTPRKSRAGLSSVKDSSVNLLKNCVGAGVFSISSRVNAVSTNPATLLPASALIVLMAMWATYNFYIIGETCELTDSFSYPECWGNTVSHKTQWVVTSAIVVAPIVSCLANTIVLTDILRLTFRTIGVPLAIYGNRNLVIALLSVFVLFPLCSLEDLSALKSVSVFGLFGQLIAMSTLLIRVLDKSYFPGGSFHAPNMNPIIDTVLTPFTAIDSSKYFVLASLLSYCFVSHYNAPRYYSELSDRSGKNFLKMASSSYILAALVYIVTMTLGVKLFGPFANSFVLNNFSPKDPLAIIARLSFGASVLASFPLIFLSMRNWFVLVATRTIPRLSGRRVVTLSLLSVISFLAVFFTDIGVVGSLAGGILGSSVMFIFPPLMYIRALQKQSVSTGIKPPMGTVILNALLMLSGGMLACFGTYNNILGALRKV